MGEMLYFYGLFIEKGNLFASKKRPKFMFLDKNYIFVKKKTCFFSGKPMICTTNAISLHQIEPCRSPGGYP